MSAGASVAEQTRTETLFFQVTPAGAFYATLGQEPDNMRALLLQLLSADTPVPYVPSLMARLTGLTDEDAKSLLDKMQARSLIELVTAPYPVVTGSLERILPDLIAPLGEGKVLLSDEQGFALAQCGFSNEDSEALAGMAADLMALGERHKALVDNRLQLYGCSWALVNSVGQSELGFWIICVGREKFLLIIEGMPYLNRQPFVDLTSALIRRYLDH